MTTPDSLPTASTLLVAGIRNEQSLGWSAASAWLDRDPNNTVLATTRSDKAKAFLDAQYQDTNGRISWVDVEWTNDDQIAAFGAQLNNTYGDERRLAGIIHSIAAADYSNFTTPAHELDSSVYTSAFTVSTLSLQRLVQASKQNLAENGGVVTFGFGEPGHFTAGYGGAMSVAKAALSQMVVELAASLGHATPPARTLEVITGFIPTQSGRGVAAGNRVTPAAVKARFAESSVLENADAAQQQRAAGQLAVSFVADEAYAQTTGQRIHVDAGWSLGGAHLF